MPLIFKGVPSVGEFQLSTWASMQYEHWCMWFHYFLCLSRLLLTICAIWQNLVWQFEDWELDLLLNYIYGLFKLPAPNVWSGKLLSKKKGGRKQHNVLLLFNFKSELEKLLIRSGFLKLCCVRASQIALVKNSCRQILSQSSPGLQKYKQTGFCPTVLNNVIGRIHCHSSAVAARTKNMWKQYDSDCKNRINLKDGFVYA